MSSFSPNDLVTDADLVAYEAQILTQFRQADWAEKRAKALEDWLAPILRGQGYDIERLRTRYEIDAVVPFTGAAYGDEQADATSQTVNDLDLAAIFATAATDALYIGSAKVFRGLSVRVLDTVSSVAGVLTVSYWQDAWKPLSIADGTQKVSGKPFSGGGAITWNVPRDWVVRPSPADSTGAKLYWAKLTVSATPTPGTAGQMGVIRRSALCAPVTLRTLTLIMKEAPTGAAGPWLEKAMWYETEADAALQRALPLIAGEFDTDKDDLINPDEEDQLPPTGTAGGTGYRLERY